LTAWPRARAQDEKARAERAAARVRDVKAWRNEASERAGALKDLRVARNLAGLLSKVAQALPQAGRSPDPSARAAEQQGCSPAGAAALCPVAPEARATAAVARKMEAASIWLDRLDVTDPQCERVLSILQTCALTLSLLSGSTRPHEESSSEAMMQRLMKKRPTISGWERA